MNVRPAVASDLDAIVALERDGFAAVDRWSERAWHDELAATNRVVLCDDTGAAVITIQIVGPVSDLNRIVVAPGVRRHGLGRALVAAGLDVAREAGCAEMLLEVRADNGPARALYAGLGFAELGRRVGYYGDGTDALILRAELAGAEMRGGKSNE